MGLIYFTRLCGQHCLHMRYYRCDELMLIPDISNTASVIVKFILFTLIHYNIQYKRVRFPSFQNLYSK